MKRTVLRLLVTPFLVLTIVIGWPTPSRAQFVVYDPANWTQAVLQVTQLVDQLRFWLRQARRLPLDMVTRYHGHSVDWTLHDLDAGLLFARRLLTALNTGDPTGVAYRQTIDRLDVPTDVLGRMPVSLQRRLTNAYAALELADSVAALAIDQMGAMRVEGAHNVQVAKDMEKDAVSTNDDFHTQTALLNKINAATVLGLRMQDHVGKTLTSTLEQMIVANTRQREAEALLLNATIYQWRYGQEYGQGFFRNTASALDGWSQR